MFISSKNGEKLGISLEKSLESQGIFKNVFPLIISLLYCKQLIIQLNYKYLKYIYLSLFIYSMF